MICILHLLIKQFGNRFNMVKVYGVTLSCKECRLELQIPFFISFFIKNVNCDGTKNNNVLAKVVI